MPVDHALLDILVCPVTRVSFRPLNADQLSHLNRAIEAKQIYSRNGLQVEHPITEGLITNDGKTIYRIDEGIPVTLAEEGIAANQVPGW